LQKGTYNLVPNYIHCSPGTSDISRY